MKTHFQQFLFLLGVVCSSAVVLGLRLFLGESALCFQQPAGHRVQGRRKTGVQLRPVFTKLRKKNTNAPQISSQRKTLKSFVQLRERNLVGECVPRLSESSLLLARFGASPHGRQQRDDGSPLFTEGHHKGMKYLAGAKKARDGGTRWKAFRVQSFV